MIVIGKKANLLISLLRDQNDTLDEIRVLLSEKKSGMDLTRVLESNQKFMDTLTHFLAMEEKIRMRDSVLEEARKKGTEETPGDTRY
jgi:hypothetical protein